MCVCVNTPENSSFCISGITRPTELKFSLNFTALPLISFSLKLISGLEFYDNLIFLKNVCNQL